VIVVAVMDWTEDSVRVALWVAAKVLRKEDWSVSMMVGKLVKQKVEVTDLHSEILMVDLLA
jgi:hypothetical protein